ncbi:hypothetical protein XU18_4096 [Perkinsela sp. CCAP 1560/4]|nr:hypothetical protein XU18_4096 [Perkinsela sp. CCAP 1560/4]|eukprot:KNH04731.1 hypothetical protein XU18_4096 [Perkinsela sp. CCAP 1560/4]
MIESLQSNVARPDGTPPVRGGPRPVPIHGEVEETPNTAVGNPRSPWWRDESKRRPMLWKIKRGMRLAPQNCAEKHGSCACVSKGTCKLIQIIISVDRTQSALKVSEGPVYMSISPLYTCGIGSCTIVIALGFITNYMFFCFAKVRTKVACDLRFVDKMSF